MASEPEADLEQALEAVERELHGAEAAAASLAAIVRHLGGRVTITITVEPAVPRQDGEV